VEEELPCKGHKANTVSPAPPPPPPPPPPKMGKGHSAQWEYKRLRLAKQVIKQGYLKKVREFEIG